MAYALRFDTSEADIQLATVSLMFRRLVPLRPLVA
jgi:hypothetical protein